MKINGEHLKRAVGETVDILKKEKEFLNDINVFPVADGDTGTNMYLTLLGTWESVKDLDEWRANAVSQAIAEASLLHAKGNSGVILSQFFWGFAEGVDGKEELGLVDLARAFSKGASYAYSAVANPVEGTILTVMRETAEWASRFVHRVSSVSDFFRGLLRKGVEALEKTPELLSRIGKPPVIDSGAYGFTLFLEGFARSVGLDLVGKRVRGVKVEKEKHEGELYCSNFLVKGASQEVLRKIAQRFGDSVVVVGKGDTFKVHVHTGDPSAVEEALSAVGEVMDRRVERIW
ncbi:MAG: DAK2 domain-containing protein [Candidatus Diapherotrites archaeon]|nr:DAK2 domain-containing protein [Candidatus Diapherotrites archaeon]